MHRDTAFSFDVSRPQRLSRLLILVKWLLVFPHLLVLWAFGILAGIASFIGWWAVLITGRYPAGLWGIVFGYMRWTTRVRVYTTYLRDEYPPFGDEPYPMQFELRRPERQSRLLLFARIITGIPLALWLSLVGIWFSILTFVAFFAILFTGNIPEGMYRSIVGIMRYSLKVSVYMYVLTDSWPGFGID